LNFFHSDIEEFLSVIELTGVTRKHIKEVKRALENYSKYILFSIDKTKSLNYFKSLQKEYSIKYYKKQMHAIRKFLHFLKIDWADEISLPKDPNYSPKRISRENIEQTLSYFEGYRYFIQIKALVYLGTSSGLRAEELYQLIPEDINIKHRTVYVNHEPKNGQTTKTGISRISFFNRETQLALIKYFEFFYSRNDFKRVFSQTHVTHLFRKAPIRVKDLRKFFSQEWDRRGGPTSIKKILMGHSLRGDVDLMHYNFQSEEDLKKIYDKVMTE
jgi:integrase/recombinase XerD